MAARLPTVGGDNSNWGTVLNTFLAVSHNDDGTLKNRSINVKDFGATGDGTTDDTASLQAAIDSSSQGDTILFPRGTYLVSAIIKFRSRRAYIGTTAAGGANLKQANGANLTAIGASAAWANDATASDDPILLQGLSFDGNRSNNTLGSGFICMNYNAMISDCYVTSVPEHGFIFSDTNSSGTAISNTMVENRIINCRVYNPGGRGIWVKDTASSGKITDGYCQNNIIATPGDTAIYIQRAAGWFITNNHVYSCSQHGIMLQAVWCTYVIGNEVEGFSTTSSLGTYRGLDLDGVIAGRPSVVIGNVVAANENAHPLNGYIYFRVRNSSTGLTTNVVFSNNVATQDSSGGASSVWASWQPNSGTLNLRMSNNLVNGPGAATTGSPGTVNKTGTDSVATKGDLLVAASAGVLNNLPVGSNDQVLVADSTQTLGVKWAANSAFTPASVAPGGANDSYSDYGNRAAGILETMSRDSTDPTSGSPSPSAGTLGLTYFTPDQSVTISNLSSASRGTAQVGATLAKMALYSIDGSGNLTCIARTASDTTLWQTTQTLFTKVIADNGAASPGAISSVALTRGSRYAFAVLHVGSSVAPTLAGKGGIAGMMSASPRRGGYVTSQTDIPASITAATINGNTSSGNYYYGRMS